MRKIPSYAGQQHYPCLFWSAPTGGDVEYESRLELDRLWLADLDPQVAWLAVQPLWLSGRDGAVLRRHVPDLLFHQREGSLVLVDVKPPATMRATNSRVRQSSASAGSAQEGQFAEHHATTSLPLPDAIGASGARPSGRRRLIGRQCAGGRRVR